MNANKDLELPDLDTTLEGTDGLASVFADAKAKWLSYSAPDRKLLEDNGRLARERAKDIVTGRLDPMSG